MNKVFYLIAFIVISIVLLKTQRDPFVDFCKSYDNHGQHCPYRVKFKNGIDTSSYNILSDMNMDINKQCNCDKQNKEISPLYNQDILNGTYGVKNNVEIVEPKCNQPKKKTEFIMFADKYPVQVKSNSKMNNKINNKKTQLCK
jgi:hypothetical protein